MFNLSYFPIQAFSPDGANGSGDGADRFPAVSRKVNDPTAAGYVKRSIGEGVTCCVLFPATGHGRDGRPAATTADVVDGWVRNHLPNTETFEMLRRSPPQHATPPRHQGQTSVPTVTFGAWSLSLTGSLSFRAGYRSAPPAHRSAHSRIRRMVHPLARTALEG